MRHTFTRREKIWFYGFLSLLLPAALLTDLGLMTFIDDESIRALVALEMDISGNYIVPTLHGEPYYNKPPLYNWFLLLWFRLFGGYTEWASRSATVFCLIGYATTVFYFTRRYFNDKIAVLNALFLLTCGRILIYDSMLGLIDPAYSWLTFTGFMLLFTQYEKRNFYALFLLTYLITAAGFMMKGLPSLVFQAGSLVAFFIWKKDFKKLFTPAHFAGIALFILLTGAYYFAYARYHSLTTVFTTLIFESSRRTAAEHGFGETLLHLFTFPFEFIYHFLPWTFLVLLFWQKNIVKILRARPFLIFCLLMFFVNILVYWWSVQVYPRYLFMLLPLIFTPLLYLYFAEKEESFKLKTIHFFLGIICAAVALLLFLPLFLERTAGVPFLYPKSIGAGIVALFLCRLFIKFKKERLLLTVAVLLVGRLGFDWFVLPDRHAEDWGTRVRTESATFGEHYQDRPLYILSEAPVQVTNSFYISRAAGKPVRYLDRAYDRSGVYLAHKKRKYLPPFTLRGTVAVRSRVPGREVNVLAAE